MLSAHQPLLSAVNNSFIFNHLISPEFYSLSGNKKLQQAWAGRLGAWGESRGRSTATFRASSRDRENLAAWQEHVKGREVAGDD